MALGAAFLNGTPTVRALAEAHDRNADLAEDMVRQAVNVPAETALRRDLVEIVAPSERELLAELDGLEVSGPKRQTLDTDGLRIERRDMPLHYEIQQFLVNPTIAYLLLLGGLMGLVFELLSPGLVGPGVLGAVAFVLGLLFDLPVQHERQHLPRTTCPQGQDCLGSGRGDAAIEDEHGYARAPER